ncbi:MAG TPA: archease [Mariprofundaceae bacterium]|nr:archease [Mariprofundaceae bacterium]
MQQAHWQHFPHAADIGVRGIGPSLHESFEQAALALTAVVSDPETIEADTAIHIRCEAPDDELLLVDWLNAVIYEMAVRHMLFSHFDVTIENHHLQATAWGEAIDPMRHPFSVEVKGATYTALRVSEDNRGWWHAQCVVDV